MDKDYRCTLPGVAFASLSAILLAAQYPLINLALGQLSGTQVAFAESIIVFLLASICCLFWRLPPPGLDIRLICASIANVFGIIFLFHALNLVDPTVVSLGGRFYFIYTFIYSVIFLSEKVDIWDIFFLFLLVAGASGSVIGPNATFDASMAGILLSVLFPLGFAIQNGLSIRSARRNGSIPTLLTLKACAVPFITGYILVGDETLIITDGLSSYIYVFIASLLSGFFGLAFFYVSLNYTSFLIANIVKGLQPIFVFLLTQIWHPKALTLQLTVCFVLVFIAATGLLMRRRD